MPGQETVKPETGVLDYESVEEDEGWEEEPELLSRRPRRRLLAPIPLALIAVLLIACGFLAGVEVQKAQTSSTSGAGAGLASRLAAFGAGSPNAASAGRAGAAAGSGSTGAASAFPGAGRLGGAVTTGEVSYVRGNTIYVANSQGNTVKVSTTAGSKVTKTVATHTNSIHPGDTVVVLGTQNKNGAISASSVSVGASGLGGLTAAGGSSSNTGASGAGGAAATLFGSG